VVFALAQLLFAREPRVHAATRSSLRPLHSDEGEVDEQLGRNKPREREGVDIAMASSWLNARTDNPRVGLLQGLSTTERAAHEIFVSPFAVSIIHPSFSPAGQNCAPSTGGCCADRLAEVVRGSAGLPF
jgi:hypothetical protein